MSTTDNSNAIDEKKQKDTETTNTSYDFKGFITNYITSIIFTICVLIFIIGTLGLFTTKVAQSNILPDDIELAPYTVFDRVVNDIPIDINIMRPSLLSENKEILSQKALFNSKEYLDSFNKSFLCSIKKSADPNGGLFANAPLYFSKVFDNLVAKNLLAINKIFLYLSYLPESVIMILYGFFGIFLWSGLYFFNVCISIFYHIVNIPQLFRNSVEQSSFFTKDDNKKWEDNEDISFLRFIKFIMFFFIWLPIGCISAFIVPIFFTIYGLLSPLFATYKIKQNNENNFTVIDFIKDTFAYKKFLFVILATLSLMSNGIKYLGNNALIGILIAIIFAYFMGLYTNDMPEQGINGFSFKIRQNIIQAKVSEISSNNPLLVKVCEPIIEHNRKIEKKLNGKNNYRELTKPLIPKEIIDENTIQNNQQELTENSSIQTGGIRKKQYKIRFT
jgi:hypothetical protein